MHRCTREVQKIFISMKMHIMNYHECMPLTNNSWKKKKTKINHINFSLKQWLKVKQKLLCTTLWKISIDRLFYFSLFAIKILSYFHTQIDFHSLIKSTYIGITIYIEIDDNWQIYLVGNEIRWNHICIRNQNTVTNQTNLFMARC